MKKKIVWFVKALVACVVAFCILTGFCAFYYNLPIHYTNPGKATDYHWEKQSYSIRCTEGFAKVRVDNNGFVNTYTPKSENIDALIMGSSHTEAFNVAENENYAYLLNEKFSDTENDLYFYNIGTSGHTFARCLRNLESAIEEYNPEKYIVIETTATILSLKDMENILNGTLDYLPSHDSGLIYYLQKSDLFRLLYAQFSNVLENENLPSFDFKTSEKTSGSAININDDSRLVKYEKTLDAVLKNSSEIAENNGCKLIIAYIPQLEIDYSGNVTDRESADEEAIFECICKKYDIGFVNMYQSFAGYYEENNTLLQGFSNTGVGVGHINKYGHKVIAEELYSYIMEENKK